MAKEFWASICEGSGVLPDGTKPLPETNADNHQLGPVMFT